MIIVVVCLFHRSCSLYNKKKQKKSTAKKREPKRKPKCALHIASSGLNAISKINLSDENIQKFRRQAIFRRRSFNILYFEGKAMYTEHGHEDKKENMRLKKKTENRDLNIHPICIIINKSYFVRFVMDASSVACAFCVVWLYRSINAPSNQCAILF